MLVISSATKNAYIALEHNEKHVQTTIDANCKQSENVLVAINQLLEENDLDLDSIKEFGVVVGPGSFTGIRIGVSLVKGLCAGKKLDKVIAISTFDVMARQILKEEKPENDFICVIDALSNLVYMQEFDKNGKPINEAKIISKVELDSMTQIKYGLEEENVCENKIQLQAETLIETAKDLREINSVDVRCLEPIYLRKSQAEENLNKNKKTS